jgi:hypothetical protein
MKDAARVGRGIHLMLFLCKGEVGCYLLAVMSPFSSHFLEI